MLPKTEYEPPFSAEFHARVGVPQSGRFNLRLPPAAIRARAAEMLWAAVPKATVQKYGDTFYWKHEICPAPKVAERLNVNSITKTRCMHSTAEFYFRSAIAARG